MDDAKFNMKRELKKKNQKTDNLFSVNLFLA